MADTAALVVALSAQLSKFESDMKRANDIADKSTREIENKFNSINLEFPGLEKLYSKLKLLVAGGVLTEALRLLIDLTGEVAKLGDEADRLGVSTKTFQELRGAFIESGASAQDATNFLATFSRKVQDAAVQTNELSKFLKANGIAAADFAKLPLNDQIARFADLIRNANAEQRQFFTSLAGGRDISANIVNALAQGAKGFEQLGKISGEIVGDQMIRDAQKFKTEFSKDLDELTTDIGQFVVAAVRSFKGIFKEVSDDYDAYIESVKTKNKEVAGETRRTVPDVLAPEAVPLPTARPASAPQMPRTVGPPSQETEDYNKLIEAQQKRIGLLEVEANTVEQSVGNQAALKAEIELQNSAIEKGITLTPARIAAFSELATKTGEAAQRAYDAQRAWAGLNSAVQFAGQQLVDVLDAIIFKTSSLEDSVKNLTKALVNALLQAAILGGGPLAGITGLASTTPGGTGGILGALFTRRQSGGPVAAGRGYLVGEHGAELFVPKNAGTIVPGQVTSGATGGLKVTVNNYAAGDTQTTQQRRQGPDGEELIIGIVKREMASGGYDGINRGRFGLRPQKVR